MRRLLIGLLVGLSLFAAACAEEDFVSKNPERPFKMIYWGWAGDHRLVMYRSSVTGECYLTGNNGMFVVAKCPYGL